MTGRDGYRGIEDYALIGDCHGAALVSSEASVDWCAPLRFDGDPVFFRLIDAGGGGCWTVEPEGVRQVSRRYLERTNILCTRFETDTGALEVYDYMPVGRTRTASVHDYVTLNAPGWLVRRFDCVEGHVRLSSAFRPRGAGFATDPLAMEFLDGRIDCENGLTLWAEGRFEPLPDGARVSMDLRAGESRTCVLTTVEPLGDPRRHARTLFDTTCAYWREWCEYSRYRGPYQDMVWRSALALKLLCYAPTGAIVAAPTTSLPEQIGGTRNWDYRFSWIRDSTFALFSLSVLGYSAEGARFSDFLSRRCLRPGSSLRIMYGVEGEPFLEERELHHLDGYRGSRPVRVGNRAAEQRQIDVFGELLDWAELRVAMGTRLEPDEEALMCSMADHVCNVWCHPDHGIWEMRCAPRHFTQGKAMAWVTLDRAIRLFGERAQWVKTRDAILRAIREEGVAGDPPYLTQSFGSEQTDAALLQVPLLGLPLEPALIRQTVKRVEEVLRFDDHVYRYRGEDGLEGSEGAFFITSFWLVEALLTVDRADDARRLFEALLKSANDVGLYAEEIDPTTGRFLGNFPQAFTHLSLISSAALLDLHARKGAKALQGSNADRARRIAGATEGAKALAYALMRNRRVRLFSSKASVLALR